MVQLTHEKTDIHYYCCSLSSWFGPVREYAITSDENFWETEADPDGFSLIPPLDAGLTKQQVCHKLKQQLGVAVDTSFSLSQLIMHIQSTFIEPCGRGFSLDLLNNTLICI